MIFMLLCPIRLAVLQFWRPVLTLVFEVQQIEFDFSTTYRGTHIFKYINPAPFWSITLTKIFNSLSFMWNGGEETFSGLINGIFTTFFCHGIRDTRLVHSFESNDIFCPCYPTHKESNSTFCCQARQERAMAFKFPQRFKLYFYYWIFSKSSFIFS